MSLLFDTIIAQILSYLPDEEAITFTEVSKQWYKVGAPRRDAIRKSNPLAFLGTVNFNQDGWLTSIKCTRNILTYYDNHPLPRLADLISRSTNIDLDFVKYHQTEKICLAAVNENYRQIKKVKYVTKKIKQVAVTTNGYALQYIDEQDENLCLMAVCNKGLAVKFAKVKTFVVFLAAVQQDGYAIEHLNPTDFTEEEVNQIYLAAVQQNGHALMFIENQTEEICQKAVEQNSYALSYVKKQTPELQKYIVQKNGCVLNCIVDQTSEICYLAVKQNISAINHVRIPTEELSLRLIEDQIIRLKYQSFSIDIQGSFRIMTIVTNWNHEPFPFWHIKNAKRNCVDATIEKINLAWPFCNATPLFLNKVENLPANIKTICLESQKA